MHLMALGMFLFELGTLPFEELQRRMDWRHARAPRIGTRDGNQYVGPGDDTISLSGATYAELSDGSASLDDLRAMAATGEAWPLVSGSGRVYGNFVITAIDERQTYFFPDGTPRRIDIGIDLWGVDDPAATTAQQANA